MNTVSENRGRQNQRGVHSEQDLIAMRLLSPESERITVAGLFRR